VFENRTDPFRIALFFYLGKDEVADSNPAISSRETVRNDGFFVVLGLILQDFSLLLANLGYLVCQDGHFVNKGVTFSRKKVPEKPCAIRVCGLFSVSHTLSHSRG
ncbi:MAG: hypothetical protein IJO67_06775, partial [Clostridia bacterium]|nr:hypothetical protein [Clostridia bacterium]